MKFSIGFKKTAAAATGFFQDAKKMDYAGLGLLAAAPVYHGVKGIKGMMSGDKTKKREGMADTALAGTEVAGLGLLARAVQKGH